MTDSNKTLIHLLGYLTPAQWAHALLDKILDKKLILELIQEQEKEYGFGLLPDIQETVFRLAIEQK